VFIIVQGHDSPHNNDHILLASSVKTPGSARKKTLGGIDGSSTDMGLLTSWDGGGSSEPTGFSGVLGAASKVADGEGADDVSAENGENWLMKSVIADQSISGEGNVELSEQNDAGGEVDTSGGKVVGNGNCKKLKSSNDPRLSSG